MNHADHCLALLESLSGQMAIALGRYCKGKMLVLAGQYGQASELFAQGLQFCRELPSKHLEFTGLMLRAYSWLKQENPDCCKSDLKAALGIAATEQDYWTFPFWDHTMLTRLCAFALQQNIEMDYVIALIRKWRLLPPKEMYALESWPWSIYIHTLGRFSVLVDETKVPPKGKTLEMLKVLIALVARDVHLQSIGDLLWPDAEGDQAQQNLKTTLHRLRKIIGQQALQLNDRKLTLDPKRVWVDLWAFDRLLNELESSPDNQLEKHVLQVFDRYRGGMLPGETSSWIHSPRERLRNRFLRITGQATERLCQLGHWQAAIDCYRKALETDPLAERFYIGLMRCHHQLGQMAEGLAVYARCREILETELKTSPSTESEQWHALFRQAD
jgi:DNA-binding SARP family transcriptional activator